MKSDSEHEADDEEDQNDDSSDPDDEHDSDNDSDSEDSRQGYDAESWFFYYQRLYDLEHNVDAAQYDPDEYIYKVARDRCVFSRDCGEEYLDLV